jgi:hypothetical protein
VAIPRPVRMPDVRPAVSSGLGTTNGRASRHGAAARNAGPGISGSRTLVNPLLLPGRTGLVSELLRISSNRRSNLWIFSPSAATGKRKKSEPQQNRARLTLPCGLLQRDFLCHISRCSHLMFPLSAASALGSAIAARAAIAASSRRCQAWPDVRWTSECFPSRVRPAGGGPQGRVSDNRTSRPHRLSRGKRRSYR